MATKTGARRWDARPVTHWGGAARHSATWDWPAMTDAELPVDLGTDAVHARRRTKLHGQLHDGVAVEAG